MTSNGKGARLRLKEPTGWFAAGASFEAALVELSDGAFRLFAWICLKANRHTGRFESTHRELAATLSRSKRAIGNYVLELEQKGICRVRSATNQHGCSWFEITDGYWPYERIQTERSQPRLEGLDAYIREIADLYLKLGCGSGSFSAADQRTAIVLFKRGIPLSVVQDAILLGCARKYVSSLTGAGGGSSSNGSVGWAPIGSLAYFEPLIEEVRLVPFSPDYRQYVRAKARAYAQSFSGRRRSLMKNQESAGAKK